MRVLLDLAVLTFCIILLCVCQNYNVLVRCYASDKAPETVEQNTPLRVVDLRSRTEPLQAEHVRQTIVECIRNAGFLYNESDACRYTLLIDYESLASQTITHDVPVYHPGGPAPVYSIDDPLAPPGTVWTQGYTEHNIVRETIYPMRLRLWLCEGAADSACQEQALWTCEAQVSTKSSDPRFGLTYLLTGSLRYIGQATGGKYVVESLGQQDVKLIPSSQDVKRK
jgi:hypothetical protein